MATERGRGLAQSALVLSALTLTFVVPRRLVQAEPRSAQLAIVATGFRHTHGHAEAKLFRPGENVLGVPFRRARVVPHAGQARFQFADLPLGDYALVVFHDENDNGKIDHNFLGLPAEPLGFSNGFSPGLFAGMPSFEKLKFAFRADGEIQRIRVE
jgi:uncharacterized protein (DUF2141 family)